ncbi:MAG: SprT family zinc-dependent metalloprotease [Patescibacteria group bacterium]|nr:SprT family zinc-dependent metalloprotease [Patescibacteria group bacterium]
MSTEEIQYTERPSTRARNLGLTVYPDRRVVVTVPQGTPPRVVSDYVAGNTEWVARRLKELEKYEGCVGLPGGRRDYLKHKERARSFVHSRLGMYNNYYRLPYNRVSIKNLKSAWGSCSELGNLNYNYKLVHLPEPLAEYIVVHELCHLAEFNHSKRFWMLVAHAIPDHKVRRKTLRKYLM